MYLYSYTYHNQLNLNKMKKVITSERAKLEGFKSATYEEITFPVKKEKPSYDCNPDCSHDILGFIDQRWLRLATCSDVYNLVSNSDMFKPIRNEFVNRNIKFEEKYLMRGNSQFFGEFIIKDNPYKVAGTEDIIYPKFMVQRSYDTKIMYNISAGLFRQICLNGLNVPVINISEINLMVGEKIVSGSELETFNTTTIGGKHTKQLDKSLLMLKQSIDIFMNIAHKYSSNFNLMAEHAIENIEDRILEVTKAAKYSLGNNPKAAMEYIKGIINKEAIDLYGGVTNDFLVYNGLNSYIYNSTDKKSPEVKQNNDRQILSVMLQDYIS